MATPSDKKVQIIDVRTFSGLNTIDDPISLDPGESPYMLNMDITKNGALQVRFGYELAFEVNATTGGLDGILPYYKTNGTDADDYLIAFHSNGNAYQFLNTNTAATGLGSYGGTSTGYMRGTTFGNYIIWGNGTATPKKYDAVTASSDLSATEGSIFAVFGKRLYVSGDEASPSRVNYSDIDTVDDNLASNFILVDYDNGQDVQAMVGNTDFLQVMKDDSVHGINYSFDENYAITVPQQQPIIAAQNGCYAPSTAQSVYGYTYYLGRQGVNSYGPNPQRVVADLPLPLSLKIDPTMQSINFEQRNKFSSAFFDNKYYMSTAMGRSDTVDMTFIYNENVKRRFGYDNWTAYNGFYPSAFAVYRDVYKRDQLYFSSAFEPKIFRFNQTFSDAGFGYERIWRSKTFQNGERTMWIYLDLEGSKTAGAVMYVDLVTDGIDVNSVQITDENFVLSSVTGGYIGDNYVGDQYVGGAFSTTVISPMYKWKKRIRIPSSVNYGYNMYFQIRNFNENEGWKMNRYKLAFIIDPEDPSYYFTN